MTSEEFDSLTEPERAAAILLVFAKAGRGAKFTNEELYERSLEHPKSVVVRFCEALQSQAEVTGFRPGERYGRPGS